MTFHKTLCTSLYYKVFLYFSFFYCNVSDGNFTPESSIILVSNITEMERISNSVAKLDK